MIGVMKIGITLHPYDEKNPAGLARAILELVKAVLKEDTKNEYIIYLKNKPREPINLPGNNWRVEVLGDLKPGWLGQVLWLDRGLRRAAKADVYVFYTPIMPIFFKPPKSVVIVLDFAYKYFAPVNSIEGFKEFLLFQYHKFSAKRADKILAISQSAKDDTVRFCGVNPDKIDVMYLGLNPICGIVEEKIDAPEKFFLFVGVIKERKNVFNIIKAFNEFRKKIAGYKLVVCGNKSGEYYEEIVDYVKKEGLERDVVFSGYVTDAQVFYLYKRARALVFPSIVEGFGFPVVEAMDCGLAVITSKTTSLPEVGGEAAILVDPYSVSEIASAMVKLSQDENLRQELVRKGYEQAKRFSWEKAAEALLDAVRKFKNK